MGVYKLETYMQDFVKNGFVDVDLKVEIERFRKNNHGRKPILVFDCMSLIKLLCCKFRNEMICGGRHWIFSEYLDDLFSSLVKAGAELVFYLDGFVQDSKFATWQKRQNLKYQLHLKVIDKILKGAGSYEIVDKFGNEFYTNTILGVIEAACSKYGNLKYAVTMECDQEISQFSQVNSRVLAVFSNDTDFLIFSGPWQYFSTKDLNSKSLTTKAYSRNALRAHLKMDSYQLAIFASISGNDFVPYVELKHFHKKMEKSSKDPNNNSVQMQQQIAKFIRSSTKRYDNTKHLMTNIAKKVFGSDNQVFVDKLEKSVNFYRSVGDVTIDDFLLHQQNIFTYNVLNGNTINFSLLFFDLRRSEFRTYYELSVPMFQRQAGAIFMMNSMADKQLTICTKIKHEENYRKMTIVPIFPEATIPSMELIWSDDLQFNNYRFTLLKWMIDWDKLKDFNLEDLPEEYLLDILTIIFLKQRSVITWKEADILLWTIKNVNKNWIPKHLKLPAQIDPRAFKIAFLYGRIYANILRCFEICGLKKLYGKPLSFDGVFFHHEYLRLKNFDVEFETFSFKYLNEL